MPEPRVHNQQTKVFEFLQSHPDTEFSIDTLVTHTGLQRQQVSSAAYSLVKKNCGVMRGKVKGFYYFTKTSIISTGLRERDILEVLRVRSDGEAVVTDGDGTLYVARPVTSDAVSLSSAIESGQFDGWLELILAAGHNRKRALRGTPGFRDHEE